MSFIKNLDAFNKFTQQQNYLHFILLQCQNQISFKLKHELSKIIKIPRTIPVNRESNLHSSLIVRGKSFFANKMETGSLSSSSFTKIRFSRGGETIRVEFD